MKTLRLLAALMVAALLSPLAFPQESSEVASLLAKARRGNGIAQYNVGLAYSEGRGVAADPIEAFVWLSLARENGARGRALDNLIGTFDRPTLELAQRRLTERRTELGVRTQATVSARTGTAASTTTAQAAVIPGPAAKEIAIAPKSPAPSELATPAQTQTDDAVARLQAEREALAARLTVATADVTALRAERDRLINLTAGHEKNARAATEANQALQEKARLAEARSTELGLAADITKGELTRVRMALTAAQKAAQPVLPTIPDLRERVAELEAQLVAAKSSAPDTAALDQKTRELQAALTELEASRAFGRQVEDTLNKVNDDRARVAATATAELEAARAFGQQVETTLNRVTDQKTALETALRAAESARDGYAREYEAAKTQLAAVQTRQPAAPAYPDLRARVTELETNLAAASSEAAGTKQQVIALTQAKAETEKSLAARPSAPAYPDLRSRVAAMETALASASADATRLQQEATTQAQAKVEAQQQIAALTQSRETAVSTLSRELDSAKSALAQANDALRAKPATPTYPDLRNRVTELESQLAGATADLSAVGSAKADLSGRVAELERDVAAARSAAPAYPDLSGRVNVLEAQLAQTKSAPAYPDLTGRVAELESAFTAASTGLAQAQAQLAAKSAAPAAPSYPDLSGKVAELESQLAGLSTESARAKQEATVAAKARDDTIQKAAALELARNEVAKQFDDYKSATAAAQRERTTLFANVKLLESDKVSLRRQVESAGTEAGQLRTQVATLKEQLAAKPASPTYPDLSGRVAQLEAALHAKPGAPAYPDLSGRVAELESAYTAASTTLAQTQTALAAAKAAPVYPDLSGKVAELEGKLAAASKGTPAYLDYTSLVKDLTTEVTKLRTLREQQQQAIAALTTEAAGTKQAAAAATKAKEDALAANASRVKELEAQVGQLQATLAAAPAAPSYPDLSGKVAELETALAAKSSAPTYPDLRNRVTELESQLAGATADLSAVGSAKADLSGRVAELESAFTTASTSLAQAQAALAARPAAPAYPDLSGKVAELEREVAAARSAAPAYPDLSGKVAELEATLVAKPVMPSFPDLRERVTELERELATARTSAPAYPDLSGRVSELETQLGILSNSLVSAVAKKTEAEAKVAALTRAQTERSEPISAGSLIGSTAATRRARELEAKPAYPDLSGRVSELEAQLAQAKAAPAASASPDVSSHVTELESALADSARKLVAADNAQAQLQQQLATAQAAVKAQGEGDTQLSRERDELTGRVTLLNSEVAQLRTDRERMQKMLGDAGRQLRDSSADASRIKELETMNAGLQTSLSTAYAQTGELQAALAAKPSAPAYPDLSGKVTELEREVAAVRSAAPAYPDLSGRVNELEARLAQAPTAAAPSYPDLSGKVAELETRLARATAETDRAIQAAAVLTLANASTSTPISAGALPYPDLSGRVRELEAQLAAAPKSRAPAYPNLAGRVVELENTLADTRRQLSESETALRTASQAPAPAATVAVAPETTDSSDLQKRLVETEDKLATALRGYALLQKDRDALQAKSGQANEALVSEKSSLATQVTTLTAQMDQLQAASAAQTEAVRASAALASDKDALAARLAEVETRAANAQAEATRLGESLAALQRSTGQITGDALSNRALVQQLQGANAVLAQENYQLKTMLSRTTGGPAGPLSAPTALPTARTHVVASGDSLSKISQRYYGTAGRWQEIYNANAGKLGPNGILRIGTELRIP